MAILSVNTPYVDGGTVTSTNLNALVTNAAFVAGATDSVTTELSGGAIVVKDGGISENKLNTATQNKLLQGPEIEAPLSNTEAFVGGTKAGNARGTFALDIQNKQSSTPVDRVASGDQAVAFGCENKASGNGSISIGNYNQSMAENGLSFGRSNQVTKSDTSVFGRVNNGWMPSSLIFGSGCKVESTGTDPVTGEEQQQSMAVGFSNIIKSSHGILVGNNMFASADSSFKTTEIGQWSPNISSEGRFNLGFGHALRMHNDMQVAFSVKSSSTAPVDGGATAGAEATGSLPREMFTIQRNGDDFTLYINDSGTIKSLSLGTAT